MARGLRALQRFTLWGLCTATILGSAAAGAESPSDETLRDTLELMRITGAADMGKRISDEMALQFAAAIRDAQPDIAPRAFEIVAEVTRLEYERELAEDGRLTKQLIDLYRGHFTAKELHDVVEFYRTPVGQKVIITLPVLAEESLQLSKQWAADAVPRAQTEIRRRFESEGLLIDK